MAVCENRSCEQKSWLRGKRHFHTRLRFLEKVSAVFRKQITAILFAVIMAKSTVVSLPPVPIDLLHWQDLPDQFDDRTLRRIHRVISKMQSDNSDIKSLSSPRVYEMNSKCQSRTRNWVLCSRTGDDGRTE
jgi:hypothetical protein